MSLDTYSNLKTEIANWLDDSALSSYLDTFIDLTEAELNKRLRVGELEHRATATMSTTSRFLALPSGFQEMRKLRLNSDPLWAIEQVSPHQLTMNYHSGSSKPRFFTVAGNELEFNVLPDSAYEIEMHYWGSITALSGSNTTNDILTYYPSLYLFGSLKHAASFVQDERIGVWNQEFERMVFEANASAAKNRYSPAGLVQRIA